MLHAERGLCGAGGEFLGAVVVRIMPDYRTLPFVTSANPYYDALGSRRSAPRGFARVGTPGRRLRLEPAADVRVGPHHLAARSGPGRSGVSIARSLLGRSASTDEGRDVSRVVLNDRGGIYARGLSGGDAARNTPRGSRNPRRCSCCCSCGYLAATSSGRRSWAGAVAPLGRLFAEIRASFYRKLLPVFRRRGDRAGRVVCDRVRHLHDRRSCAPTSSRKPAAW